MCSEPCCSCVCFAVGVVGALPSCFDVSGLWLLFAAVCLLCWCGCCSESAVVGCAVVLWMPVGRLEVLSHEVVGASVYESVVSGMCVMLCCVSVLLVARCAYCWVLCVLGWMWMYGGTGDAMYLLWRCGGV